MTVRFVRAATASDAARIAAIYNEGIADRLATFETRLRGPAEVEAWFAQDHLVLVAGEADDVMAYAAAFPYRARACYWGVRDFSIYAAREARGRGFGRLALDALIRAAEGCGYWKLLSRVFPENAASRGLLESFGFRDVGTYRKHAKLDGQWRDVVIVEKLLV